MVLGDIADVPAQADLVDRIFAAFGQLDCLVNNAGILVRSRALDLLEVTPDTFDRVMGVNLRGTFFLTQNVAKRMIEREDPASLCSIITIGSGVSGKPRMESPEYTFSKTCLSLMSQIFALRLAQHNICTYEVRPGVIRTEMSRDVWDRYEGGVHDNRFPMGRLGYPEDVGRVVAALATGMLPYSTGDRINVDGGLHIAG
jgi:NAD(P)-dependent dehydrogenase (short-subunit alcohol dehydrogenase family)